VIESENKDAAGTSDMIFMYPDGKKGAMRNPYLSMANEATLVYKKSFVIERDLNLQVLHRQTRLFVPQLSVSV
jgi:hypothetical protein